MGTQDRLLVLNKTLKTTGGTIQEWVHRNRLLVLNKS